MPELDEVITPLFPEETEDAIRARWNAWANEGTAEDDPRWTDTREGSYFQVTTQPGVRESAKHYDAMNEVVAASMPVWAWGDYLDDHGEYQSILRLAATFATGVATFTGDPATDIVVGTRVGVVPADPDAEPIEYEVTESGTIPDAPADPEVDLPIRAVEAGSQANVAAEAVTEYLGGESVTLTNAEPITGGTDTETDEGLRERILDAYEGRGAGNVRDYRAWARSFPGVGRATVIAAWDGPNTVRVIVSTAEGGEVSAEVLDGLQAFLDPDPGKAEGEAPVGATVTVSTAAGVDIVIGATIEFEESYSLDGTGGTVALAEAIQAAITLYVESVEPGGEVVISQVSGRIVGVPGVHDVGDVEINGAAVNFAIDDDPPLVPIMDDFALVEGDV